MLTLRHKSYLPWSNICSNVDIPEQQQHVLCTWSQKKLIIIIITIIITIIIIVIITKGLQCKAGRGQIPKPTIQTYKKKEDKEKQ